MRHLSKQEMYTLAGLTYDSQTYSPSNIGKRGKEIPSTRTFFNHICDVDFVGSQEMRTMLPEYVYQAPISVEKSMEMDGNIITMSNVEEKYKAIVGQNTQKVYSVMTDRYEPVQHSQVLSAIADMSDDVKLNLFGKLDDKDGVMNCHAVLADPEYHVNVLDTQKDPFMMGIRVFNSHTGTTGFGAEIFGIRMVCSNYGAYGEMLGKINFKHFLPMDKVADQFRSLLANYLNKIPNFEDKMNALKVEIVEPDCAEDILWGTGLNASAIQSISMNLKKLNREINDDKNLTVYQLYNAGTAYVTHRSASDNSINTNIDNSHRLEKILVSAQGDLIDRGEARRLRWEEAERKKLSMSPIDLSKIAIVSD